MRRVKEILGGELAFGWEWSAEGGAGGTGGRLDGLIGIRGEPALSQVVHLTPSMEVVSEQRLLPWLSSSSAADSPKGGGVLQQVIHPCQHDAAVSMFWTVSFPRVTTELHHDSS